MLTIYEIREIVKLLEQTDVESIEVKNEQSRLAIKRRFVGLGTKDGGYPSPAVPATPKPAVATKKARPAVPVTPPAPIKHQEHSGKIHKITSPMVGTFYTAPAVDTPPYAAVNDRVEKSTVVCIVEAMKLFNEIEAEVNGEIVEILAENGQLVELGQPLFLVKMDV